MVMRSLTLNNLNITISCLHIFFQFKTRKIRSCVRSIEKTKSEHKSKKICFSQTSKKVQKFYELFGISSCLLNSLSLSYIAKKYGAKPVLKIGVRIDSKDELKSHSWVEIEGKKFFRPNNGEVFSEITVFLK